MRAYFTAALEFLKPAQRYCCVGGLSGTGKSRLARRVAPDPWPVPGRGRFCAAMWSAEPERRGRDERLRADAYSAEATALVYARVQSRCRAQ